MAILLCTNMKFANFLPFFHSIKFPFQSNFVPQWSKMIPTKVGEDWSRNKKVMAILLCTNMKFANFLPFFHSIKFPFQSNFVPQWSKMIPTKVGEDWSRNKKVMAILLCTNMIFANFRPFIQDFDHFSIPSNLHFGQILFLNGQR